MTNEQAAEITIDSINVIEVFLIAKQPTNAIKELDCTVYFLIERMYFGTAWDLVKEFRFLFNKYCTDK